MNCREIPGIARMGVGLTVLKTNILSMPITALVKELNAKTYKLSESGRYKRGNGTPSKIT